MPPISREAWAVIAPETILLITAILLMVFSSIQAKRRVILTTAFLGLALCLLPLFFFRSSLFLHNPLPKKGFLAFPNAQAISSLQVDAYTFVFFLIFVLTAGATFLLSLRYLDIYKRFRGEYFALILFSTIGMMIMASARDLLVLYLGLELMSISAYILVGYFTPESKAQEASLKYFLTGALGSAIFLFGVAYLYGATGTMQLQQIGTLAASHMAVPSFFVFGSIFLLAGFAFKIAAVPFHMWAPDAYDGAPTPITAFMAVGVKAAAFSVLTRVVFVSLDIGPSAAWIQTTLVLLCIVTMIWGNVAAIAQTSVKRILAYSSIAHAGYLLLALVARRDSPDATTTAIQYYFFVYMVMTFGAFAAILIFEKAERKNLSLQSYTGLGYRFPIVALSLTLFLLSLAGIPPTAGFFGKWLIFSSAIQAGYLGLAVLGVLSSLVSVYYYMRIVYVMFMLEPTDATAQISRPFPFEQRLLTSLGILVILFGLFPRGITAIASYAQLPSRTFHTGATHELYAPGVPDEDREPPPPARRPEPRTRLPEPPARRLDPPARRPEPPTSLPVRPTEPLVIPPPRVSPPASAPALRIPSTPASLPASRPSK